MRLSIFQYINLLVSVFEAFLILFEPISSSLKELLHCHSLIGSSAWSSRIFIMIFFEALELSHLKFSREFESIMVKSSTRFSWVTNSLWEELLMITYFGRMVITFVYNDWFTSRNRLHIIRTYLLTTGLLWI